MKLLTIVTLMGLAASSQAADGGQRLYAGCAGCHGTAGAGSGGVLPVLAGQPKDALAASLRAFKAGTRPATIMQQIAKGYTEEQVVQIAAYLAAQPAREAK
ncbi:MAG: cytochrome [Massilia sp.]|nr:cytochrome [Massilia sp.]